MKGGRGAERPRHVRFPGGYDLAGVKRYGGYNLCMSSVADELFERAMQLTVDERKRLGIRLLESDEPKDDPAEVEASWAAEIERRVGEVEAGTAELLDWEEVRAHLHRKR